MRLNYICRASKARKNGLSPIELSIIINGERAILTLDRHIKSTSFNSSTQKVRGDKELNEYLETIRKKCYSIENELIKMDCLNVDNFVNAFKNGISYKEDTLLSVYDKHNELYKGNVLSGKVDNTALYKYRKSRERVAEYIKTLGKTDIRLKDITPSFVEDYQNYCLTSLKPSTANKEMKMLKKIFAFAVKERYIDVSPFQIKLKEEKLQYHPLTPQEIDMLYSKEIENERISMVRDLFIFQCYTGLSYIDMATLVKEDIVDDIIIKRRKKTDVKSIIPLLPVSKAILEQYDYRLPVISNQKYNAYLKVLGDTCGCRMILHSHLARHTYATLLLNKGVDMVTVSKTMGHSNSKITERIYAEMRKDTVVENILKGFEL